MILSRFPEASFADNEKRKAHLDGYFSSPEKKLSIIIRMIAL